MQQPLVSVVVPIYNVERFLRQCLDSIVHQTYRELEIILVDDGSSDNCGAICDEYAKCDDRIMVIHQENQGVSVARNVGIEKASGDWIMFVDPDDWLELDCCEKVLEAAKGGQWDVVYFKRREYDETGGIVWSPTGKGSFEFTKGMLEDFRLKMLSDDAVSWELALAVPWGKLYRRQLLIQRECRFPLGVKKRQDIIFNLYCLEYIERAYYYNYVGYNYLHRAESIVHQRNMKMMDIIFNVFEEYERYVLKYHSNEEAYARMLGKAVIAGQGDIRSTMFFHPDGRMPYREYCRYMDCYYDHEIVKRYVGRCRLSDFRRIKDKIKYLLIAGHHVFLYYWIFAAYRSGGGTGVT